MKAHSNWSPTFLNKEMGNNGSHFHSVQSCFFSMAGCTSDVWNSLDHVGVCCKINILLEKLAQESWLKLWNLVLGCLMWIVWNEQNLCSLEDTESTLDQLKSLLLHTLFD